jgi:hypothetical protein
MDLLCLEFLTVTEVRYFEGRIIHTPSVTSTTNVNHIRIYNASPNVSSFSIFIPIALS